MTTLKEKILEKMRSISLYSEVEIKPEVELVKLTEVELLNEFENLIGKATKNKFYSYIKNLLYGCFVRGFNFGANNGPFPKTKSVFDDFEDWFKETNPTQVKSPNEVKLYTAEEMLAKIKQYNTEVLVDSESEGYLDAFANWLENEE